MALEEGKEMDPIVEDVGHAASAPRHVEVRHRRLAAGPPLGCEDGGAPCRLCGAASGSTAVVGEGGKDEVSDTASLHKFWHRAGWLVFLLMCQSTSSVILEHFDILIRSHPVVIYFLTMLVGAGGNAGGQSTVLVVRRLALADGGKGRIVDDRFSVKRIVSQEASVGARLALVLFCASLLRCLVFQVRGVECLAICLSMLAIVFTSTLAGAALPLLLRRLHMDPAHAGATIQVVMDISGVTLTCIVSCLVLGLPLNGQVARSDTTTSSLVHGSSLAGTLHSLTAFGGDAAVVHGTAAQHSPLEVSAWQRGPGP